MEAKMRRMKGREPVVEARWLERRALVRVMGY